MPCPVLDLFPGGRRKALTLSYDDGVEHDPRFVDILNRHGLKGTFHLNSALLGQPGRLAPVEVATLYYGHEVSAHSATHPHLDVLPGDGLAREILEDRRALETLVGYPIRGMSYPYGAYDDEVVRRLPALGIEYARTTQSHGGFHLPADPLRWHPTCHHRQDVLKKADEFLALQPRRLALFYVWGHSFDFEVAGNWELAEEFGEKMAPHAGTVWFATNIDVFDYLQALRAVRTSVDGSLVQNGSHRSVWASVDGAAVEIPPGGPVFVG